MPWGKFPFCRQCQPAALYYLYDKNVGYMRITSNLLNTQSISLHAETIYARLSQICV
jgi:hypothetical protein